MKVSSLIKKLERIKAKHGDIAVAIYDPEKFDEGILTPSDAYLVLDENERGVVDTVVLADYETYEAIRA